MKFNGESEINRCQIWSLEKNTGSKVTKWLLTKNNSACLFPKQTPKKEKLIDQMFFVSV